MRLVDEAAELESFRFDETAFLKAGHPAVAVFPRSTASRARCIKTPTGK